MTCAATGVFKNRTVRSIQGPLGQITDSSVILLMHCQGGLIPDRNSGSLSTGARKSATCSSTFDAYDPSHHAMLILWTVPACQQRERAASGR